MSEIKALCIFTGLLGNEPMTRSLVQALGRVPGLTPTYVITDVDDYVKFPAPWWARLTNPWHAEFIARRKAEPQIAQPFDLLFVHGWENAIAFQDVARRMPAAVMMDAVPATMDRQLRGRGRTGWKRELSHWVHHRQFRAAVADFDEFLPKTSDCAASLAHDYGVQPERCSVTLAPQDLDWWKPRPRDFAPPWRLVFAGNDFERKGGDFLLRLYSECLHKESTLTILSNDPAIPSSLPAGVRVVKGATREQLREIYWESHIFLFPTRQDFAPQVIAEAAAAGLPAVCTSLGGIPDLIRSGETGLILPHDASLEHWAEELKRLLADPSLLHEMSVRARAFAEADLSPERFNALVADVIGRLRTPTVQ